MVEGCRDDECTEPEAMRVTAVEEARRAARFADREVRRAAAEADRDENDEVLMRCAAMVEESLEERRQLENFSCRASKVSAMLRDAERKLQDEIDREREDPLLE